MNSILKHIYSSGLVRDAKGDEKSPFPDSISYRCGELLYEHVRRHSFTRTLETGLAYGLSALFFCQAHCDAGGGLHMAIDPYQKGGRRYRRIGLLNLERAGLLQYFRFYDQPAHVSLAGMNKLDQAIDMAFLDGDHRFDYVLTEFLLLDLLLDVGGHIIFHDIWMPSVQKVVCFALKNRAYTLQEGPLGSRDARETAQILLDERPISRNPRLLESLNAPVCVLSKLAWDSRSWKHYVDF